MNPAFNTIITASDAERRDLFLGASTRLGTARNVSMTLLQGLS